MSTTAARPAEGSGVTQAISRKTRFERCASVGPCELRVCNGLVKPTACAAHSSKNIGCNVVLLLCFCSLPRRTQLLFPSVIVRLKWKFENQTGVRVLFSPVLSTCPPGPVFIFARFFFCLYFLRSSSVLLAAFQVSHNRGFPSLSCWRTTTNSTNEGFFFLSETTDALRQHSSDGAEEHGLALTSVLTSEELPVELLHGVEGVVVEVVTEVLSRWRESAGYLTDFAMCQKRQKIHAVRRDTDRGDHASPGRATNRWRCWHCAPWHGEPYDGRPRLEAAA